LWISRRNVVIAAASARMLSIRFMRSVYDAVP
jgi:hypothetical protein